MKGQAGRSVITLFFCLVFLFTLLFIFLENRTVSRAQSLTSADPEALVEIVDPRVFTGPMDDYEYDLYRKDGDRFTFVPPPELDYANPASPDDVAVMELQAATTEITPASREIKLTILPICPSPPDLTTDCSSLTTGHPLITELRITPPTKTIELEGGRGTREVFILPASVDLYVAVRTPSQDLVFLNRLSTMRNLYFKEPVVFRGNVPIKTLHYPLFGILMPSGLPPGFYQINCAMVSPGQSILTHPSTWLSDWGTVNVPYNVVE